jgi:flavorubredoxin
MSASGTSRIDNFLGDVYRNTFYVDKLKLAFSQFFVRSPSGGLLCVAAGMRSDFPHLKANLESVGIDVASVSSLITPHFEADEIAALPDFVAHNPALVTYAHPICAHALSDIFSVKTKILKDGEPITISGEVVVPIHAKHVHQWDSLVVYVPRLKALFSSDIFMSYGPVDAPNGSLDNIIQSIEKAGYLPSLDFLSAALKKIQKYDIEWIFPMHGPAISANVPETISGLIDYCETQRQKEVVA